VPVVFDVCREGAAVQVLQVAREAVAAAADRAVIALDGLQRKSIPYANEDTARAVRWLEH
jgi:hypothetical protein